MKITATCALFSVCFVVAKNGIPKQILMTRAPSFKFWVISDFLFEMREVLDQKWNFIKDLDGIWYFQDPIGKMCSYYFHLNVFVYHWLLTIQMFDVHAYIPDREDEGLDDTTSFHWYGKLLLFQSRKSSENFESVWEKSGIKNSKDLSVT